MGKIESLISLLESYTGKKVTLKEKQATKPVSKVTPKKGGGSSVKKAPLKEMDASLISDHIEGAAGFLGMVGGIAGLIQYSISRIKKDILKKNPNMDKKAAADLAKKQLLGIVNKSTGGDRT